MNDLIKLTDNIREIQHEISVLSKNMDKLIEERNKKVELMHDFLAEKIFEAFTDEQKEEVLKERQNKNNGKTNTKYTSISTDTNVTYSLMTYVTNVFDPFEDKFEFQSYVLNEDKTKIKFTVECLKQRKSLGRAGYWIPVFYTTKWIDINEINKFEL